MTYIDITRAILLALAREHPCGVRADRLAGLVDCEPPALQRQLHLLWQTGAIRAGGTLGIGTACEVRISDAALGMLRHSKAFP